MITSISQSAAYLAVSASEAVAPLATIFVLAAGLLTAAGGPGPRKTP